MARDQAWDEDEAPEPFNAWQAEVTRRAKADIRARQATGEWSPPSWWTDDDDAADDDPQGDPQDHPMRADPADARGGYRIRSHDAWAAARHDYLSGDTAEAVCARYDLRLGTLRARAARDGWRRLDQGDPEPVDLAVEAEAGLPDYDEMARHALVRLDRAVRRGRPGEAASWMRLHEKLGLMARAAAMRGRTGAPAPASRTPDPLQDVERRAAAIADLAQGALTLDLDDPAAVAAFEARLAALEGMADSDDSDGV